MPHSKDPKYWETFYTIQAVLLETTGPSQALNDKANRIATLIHESYVQV